MKRCIISFLLLTHIMVFAQEKYSVHFIPDSLVSNASIVVRDHSQEVRMIDQSSMIIHIKEVKTILKSDHNSIYTTVWYNKSRKIKDLQAIIYDQHGEVLRKIKAKDFDDYSALSSSTLFGDTRVKSIDHAVMNYPVTTELSYTVETSNTGFVPNWNPVNNFNTSIQNHQYSITCPKNMGLRHNELNFDLFPIKRKLENNTIEYSLTNQKAITQENLSLPLDKLTPSVLFAVNNFHLEDVNGYASNWNEFGKWYYDNLIRTQNKLPAEAIAEIRALTNHIRDPIEKAKIVYSYVQNRSRYISIQLGIGGWKPYSSAEVHELGYGDCKALTNYTMNLLDAVGIKSFYSVVYGDVYRKKSIKRDFTSIEGNHVILCLPNPQQNDSIWLECTSQTAPFGHIGRFTDDRDVLVVTPEGGRIQRTKKYSAHENQISSKTQIDLNDDGSASFKITRVFNGIGFSRSSYSSYSKDEYQAILMEEMSDLIGLTIKSLNTVENKDSITYEEKLDGQVLHLANTVGDNLLIKLRPFGQDIIPPKKQRARKSGFVIERAGSFSDQIIINIPATLEIQALPDDRSIHTPFGQYSSTINQNKNTIIYNRSLVLHDGEFSKDQYKSYRSFLKKVSKYDEEKILLQK